MSESSSDRLGFADKKDSTNDKRRACDRCRRQKRRCDGGEVCSQCARHELVCTYQEPAVIRSIADIQDPGGPYSHDYVENLELQLRSAEEALLTLREPERHLVSGLLKGLKKPIAPHPDDYDPLGIDASFQALSLDGPPPDPGFQGEFSDAMLAKVAVAVKSGRRRPSTSDQKSPAPKPWTLKAWDDHSIISHLSFPDSDLTSSLISLYFSNVNAFIPVLHRPIFEEAVSQGLHMLQDDFASTLLLVCALGSLYLADSSMYNQDRRKLAWNFYNQVELCGHSLRRQPTTYDLQAYCLAAHFLICASNPRVSWLIVGFGLRLVQDIGGHRRNVRASTISTEEELEKRATWILIVLDGNLAACLGRSTTLNPFDLDISLPCECDDEWWQRSGPGCQPTQIPSRISFFNCMVDLYRVLHFLLKNEYSTSKYYTASGIEDLRRLAAEVDAALDRWFSSMPQHLTWDPDRPDPLFFDQSAALHCFFYYTRILIHRPFIPAVRLTKQLELHALRSCTEAARACINVADIHRRRQPANPLIFSQDPLFTAAMVLILNMWGRVQRPADRVQDLAQVHTALDIFKSQQERWPSSGFFVTVLEHLLTLDYTPPEEPEDLSASSGNPYVAGTTTEVLDGIEDGYGPDSWIALARAWMAGVRSQQDPTPYVIAMPPVFVGDQEVSPTRPHHPQADAQPCVSVSASRMP
ncbi:fungal-specific transcription factor domain-containing protein [Mycena leptocephala]|nr:fungal-specific transcription factor domain-containing protein [Mycena leptocephala]